MCPDLLRYRWLESNGGAASALNIRKEQGKP
jgi:hypothetical protein